MPKSSLTPQQLFAFYQGTEKLKITLRHSWLSNGSRQESVAEHTWMMALLALILMPHVKHNLDQQKVLKMIIVHDLAEAITKDVPAWQSIKQKQEKKKAEKTAINKIFKHLDKKTQEDLLSLWQEYENRESAEALFVKALDSLDAVCQHNSAPTETWDKNDFLWHLSSEQDSYFNIDTMLREIKNSIDKWSIRKIKKANCLDKFDQKELKKVLRR